MLQSYKEKVKSAAKMHLKRNVSDLMQAAPGKAWDTLKKMGAQPGECGGQGGFTLTEHLEENLTTEQFLERIVTYFSALSNQLTPLFIEKLPERVQQKLKTDINPVDLPEIAARQIWQIQKGKTKTLSAVPGELPPD